MKRLYILIDRHLETFQVIAGLAPAFADHENRSYSQRLHKGCEKDRSLMNVYFGLVARVQTLTGRIKVA